MGAYLQFFAIVVFLYLVPSTPCPAICQCTSTIRPSADCSYRDLMNVPVDLPSNLNQLSLSVNHISELNATSFSNIFGVTSLWLAYNKIIIIQPGTFQHLTSLKNLDLSHNQLQDFPWTDLSTLQVLQVLNLNNNGLVSIPFGTFNSSRSLRSLQLSSNQLLSLPEGIFYPLASLSHLQLHSNSFHCSCSLAWLMDWIKKIGNRTTIDRKEDIICLSPNELKGISLEKVPDLKCKKPLELMSDDPVLSKTLLLCKEVDVPYLTIHKDANEKESYSEFLLTGKEFVKGGITVTPIKRATAYLCHVSNHTTETYGKVSVSVSHYAISGWPKEPGDKLLLYQLSDSGILTVNSGTRVVPVYILCWQVLFVKLLYKIS